MKAALLLLTCLFSLTAFSQAYKLAEGYKIDFSNSDVSGNFKKLSSPSIYFDPSNLEKSQLNFKIEVASINTGNALQNKHACGEEWFNASKFPFIQFNSSKIEKTSQGYKAIGKLQMHGVTKEISIPFTFTKSGAKGTFIANFSVVRTDYQIGKKNGGVAETIKIDASIPVIKK